ncbi:MAG: PepSY domain-containing protein [Myxococcota bacterium]
MHDSRRRPALPFVAALGFALPLVAFAAAPALAGDDDRPASAEELARVRAALGAQGYSDVHDVEVDDGRFEVDARNPAGESVDLELDLGTLVILYEDRD